MKKKGKKFISAELNLCLSVLLKRAVPIFRFAFCKVSSSSCIDVKDQYVSIRRESLIVLLTTGIAVEQSKYAFSSWDLESIIAMMLSLLRWF